MTITDEMRDVIRALALENAVKFKGRANPGAVIGPFIGKHPELKQHMQQVAKEIGSIVTEVNAMTPEQQQKEFEQKGSVKEEKEERGLFDSYKVPKGETVVGCFPPGAEKYPHIGHCKALMLNFLFTKQHNGKFILRFEDTNPKLVKQEYYDAMLRDFAWVGAKWDEVIYASDYMETFNNYAKQLITQGKAYFCECQGDTTAINRKNMTECEHRSRTVEENVEIWNKFETYKEGEITLRLKIDMEHKNAVMRDPSIYRIIENANHPRLKDKYRAYPMYDFQNAIMDGLLNVTLRFRTNEFDSRKELHAYIREILGLYQTQMIHMARFNMVGVVSSGRVIREKIQSGEMSGWDDPQLTTLMALRRRGFTPEAIVNFVISTGITQNIAELTWDDLIKQNKRILDETAKRFFFVEDPQEIDIEQAPEQEIKMNLNPNGKDQTRVFKTHESFFIAKKDLDIINNDEKVIRLIDCLNFKKQGEKFIFTSLDYKDFKGKGKNIIHFLPQDEELYETQIHMPDNTIVKGLGEKAIEILKVDDIIQFERFGFCRLDEIKDNIYYFRYAHN